MHRARAWLLILPLALVAGDCDWDDDDDCDDWDDDCDFFFVAHPPASGPAADLNLDGFADLVIGAPLHDGGGIQRGAVFVHFGSASGPSAAPGLTIFGTEDRAQFGAALAFVGDVNGQGAPDLLVGAPFDDGDGNSVNANTDRGRAFVFFGGPAMDAAPDLTMTGAEPDARFGTSVARIADTNQDGIDDWLVGAPRDDGDGDAIDDGDDRGRAFFFYGSLAPDGAADVTFTGLELGSAFGFAVNSAGDLNNGGSEDIAVGAPLDDGGGDDRGRVYVFYGGTLLDGFADLTLTGDQNDAQFGTAIAPVLDVNRDGIDDLLIGAPLHDAGGPANADRGEAYVFFGSDAPDATADLTLRGTTADGAYGAAVGGAGDADGDGVRDFLVGAPLEDPPAGTDAGRAYLYRGGAGVDAIADLVLAGAEAGSGFGTAVAGPGDVNAGGRDLLIGAPFDDADGNTGENDLDRGRVFVFFGGAALNATSDVTVSSAQDGALAGSAIGN